MGLTVEFKQRVQILGEHIENCYSTIANKQVAVWFGDLIIIKESPTLTESEK